MKAVNTFTIAYFENYLDQVNSTLNREGVYRISQAIQITRIESDCFHYTGNNWSSEYKASFKDLEKIIMAGDCSRTAIKGMHTLSAMARLHAGYFSAIAYDLLNFSEMKKAFARPVRKFAA